jgi:molecular chaperone DnaK
MIERNTTIPTQKTQVFSTYADNQTAVDIKVLQGERPLASQNKILGIFRLDGIPIAPRGVPQIEVTFDINANGILSVTAKDLGSGKNQQITITGASGLSDEEVEKFRKEAEQFAESDRKEKEKIEARNQLDSLLYQTEKQLKDTGDKLQESDKKKMEEAIATAKKVLENTNVSTEEMKSASESLSKVFQEIAQEMYKNVQGSVQSGPQPQPETKKPDDNVVDANFEVVDDENKSN